MHINQSFDLPSPAHAEKHIFIMSSCIYTTTGINELCENYAGWRVCGVARNIVELKKFLKKHAVNMLIIEAGFASLDIGTLRELAAQLDGRIILLVDENSSSLQDVYHIAGIHIAVTKTLPLSVLQSLMHWIMYAPTEALRPAAFWGHPTGSHLLQ